MKLVVFDLDGTLAETSAVDERCFGQAFADTLNIQDMSTNWLDYDHASDTAVAFQAFSKQFGREPEVVELLKVIDCFVALLTQQHSANAIQFAEVAGASEFLTGLRLAPDWGVALATGGWKRSAQFKIRSSGLPLDDVPSAFAEDGPSREAIIQTAIARASAWYQQPEFERIVSVGDALWDVQTARKLELPFLGVAVEPRAALLRDYGAVHVTPHFRDLSQCLRWLNDAVVPQCREK